MQGAATAPPCKFPESGRTANTRRSHPPFPANGSPSNRIKLSMGDLQSIRRTGPSTNRIPSREAAPRSTANSPYSAVGIVQQFELSESEVATAAHQPASEPTPVAAEAQCGRQGGAEATRSAYLHDYLRLPLRSLQVTRIGGSDADPAACGSSSSPPAVQTPRRTPSAFHARNIRRRCGADKRICLYICRRFLFPEPNKKPKTDGIQF